MVYGILVFLIGLAYGYFKKGHQDKMEIFKTGVVWALIIAAVLAVLGLLLDFSPISAGSSFVWMVIDFIIMVALFVGGVFIGDWIEGRTATA